MIYSRQKFLLGFLQTFGGSLSRTDCQKLIFLFCQYYNKRYYDFFPYHYGPFSQVLYSDKRVLTKRKFLKCTENFVLENIDKDYREDVVPKEKDALLEFYDRINGFRGRKLIAKTYNEFPYYAQNSNLLSEYIIKKADTKNKEYQLFSLGYEGITIDKYLNMLIENGIDTIFDVRANPISRKFGFSKSKFSLYANNVDIEYCNLSKLGIPSQYRKNLSSEEDLENLFSFYKTEILNKNIDQVNSIVKHILSGRRVVLTCFESDVKTCHRKFICDYISEHLNMDVVHL